MPAAAMDLRGYGDSRLGTLPSTVDDHCRDILRVMAFLGAERLVLVGLSFGAWIATSFAMRHPTLLDGLVLSGGCTGLSEVDSAARDAFRRARTAPLDAGQRPGDLAAAVVPTLLGPTAGDPVRRALWASMAAIPTATYRDAVACFTRPTERFDFSRFAFPVLLVTGEHDRLATSTEIRSVARRITRHAPTAEVRFELIADAGHVCNLEQPEAYGRLLLDFLGRWS
jgi:pimeloyl-ACP methyl ester carboxylesterase